MIQNIFVGILCVIALSAGVWGWIVDNGITLKKENKENKSIEEDKQNEKN